MPDTSKVKDEQTNPMPTGGKREAAVSLKALIGFFTIADSILFGANYIICRKQEEPPEQGGIPWYEVSGVMCSLISFALSCTVGFSLYSPMDASGTVKNTGYGELIEATSAACGRYTVLWYTKTVIASLFPITALCLDYKWNHGKYSREEADFITAVLGAGASSVSAILECIALSEASKVADGLLSKAQQNDKLAFQLETSAFIADDVRGVLDALILLFDAKNVYVAVSREVLALGSASLMFAEAGVINRK